MFRWLIALISSIFIVSFTNVFAEDSSEFIKTLDPPLEEIQEIKLKGVNVDSNNLIISESANLILPF